MPNKKPIKEKLKPCPFCGVDAFISKYTSFHIVRCGQYGKTMICPTPSSVEYPNKKGEYSYSTWNTRVSDE